MFFFFLLLFFSAQDDSNVYFSTENGLVSQNSNRDRKTKKKNLTRKFFSIATSSPPYHATMRPPPNSLQEYLYRMLIESPGFNNWVRKIHARVNRVPYQEFPDASKVKEFDVHNYQPTAWQKVNAFRRIWLEEMKQAFKFW